MQYPLCFIFNINHDWASSDINPLWKLCIIIIIDLYKSTGGYSLLQHSYLDFNCQLFPQVSPMTSAIFFSVESLRSFLRSICHYLCSGSTDYTMNAKTIFYMHKIIQ